MVFEQLPDTGGSASSVPELVEGPPRRGEGENFRWINFTLINKSNVEVFLSKVALAGNGSLVPARRGSVAESAGGLAPLERENRRYFQEENRNKFSKMEVHCF